MPRRFWSEVILVVFLTTLAFALRVYRLPEVPIGLHADEAANGLDALDILNGRGAVFFERNNGREPLFIYLEAISVALLGATPFALRLTSAVIGALTIPAVYWMVREAFVGEDSVPAFWTAALLAVSYWHVNFSRLGYRAITLPLLAALAFAAFWRAWRRLAAGGRFPWPWLILCGLFVGGSLYTYISARLLPVLVVFVAAAGALGPGCSAQRTRRIAAGVVVIGAVALAVFLPLGLYFLGNPDSFMGRAAGVAVASTGSSPGSTLKDLALNALKTARMFGVAGDTNWRHNPATRPAFDAVLSAWLAGGVVLAWLRRRSLPYLFTLAWLVILAVPALISDGAPHFLRTLVILPAACLLPALAMTEAGRRLGAFLQGKRLAGVRAPVLAAWLPLPFLIFSGALGVHDYFAAYRNGAIYQNLQDAFNQRLVNAAPVIGEHMDAGDAWVLPLWPVFWMPEGYVVEFLTRNQVAESLVKSEEELTRLATGHRYAYLLNWHDAAAELDGAYVLADAKGAFRFLLNKYGREVGEYDRGSISYTVHEIPAAPDYRFTTGLAPRDVSFAGKIKLTGIDYGHTALNLDEPAEELEEKSLPSGHQAWAVLSWQAQEPIDGELKASLYLEDEASHLAGQTDGLLLSDHYLIDRTWKQDETGTTYHMLQTLPGIPPGHYRLHLAVYDPRTMERYPVLDANGAPGAADAVVGAIEVTPAIAPQEVSLTTLLNASQAPAPGLALLGYDLAGRTARPGEPLLLTLYWQAERRLTADYTARIRLRDAQGTLEMEEETGPGGEGHLTSAWQPGEILRDWHDLALPATLPTGDYTLELAVLQGEKQTGIVDLGNLSVQGRPRRFQAPAVPQPMGLHLGTQAGFLGYGLSATTIQPGDAIGLTLYWQALDRTGVSYKVFVHLLAPDGQVWAQQDSPPGGGELATPGWMTGEYIEDPYTLVVAPDTPPGDYQIEVGMYDPDTGVRLPVTQPDGSLTGDRILLPQVVHVAGPS